MASQSVATSLRVTAVVVRLRSVVVHSTACRACEHVCVCFLKMLHLQVCIAIMRA